MPHLLQSLKYISHILSSSTPVLICLGDNTLTAPPSLPISAVAMSNGGTLPQEILTDLLSRLPVKSLCRFKCVSPAWKTLISDPYFPKAHLNRTNTNNPKQFGQNLLLLSRTSGTSKDLYSVNLTDNVPNATKLYLPSLPQPENRWADVLGSCDGLFLFSDECYSDSFLLNPSTRECKKLPPLPFVLNPVRGSYYHDQYGVGYDSSRDEYKVLMLSYRIPLPESDSDSDAESSTLTDRTIVAVYSLKTNAWRRIQDTNYILVTPSSGVYFNGCLHWFCSRAGSYVMVAFDLADEIFREVSLPALVVHGERVSYHEVVIVEDCLSLVYVPRSGNMEVWTMKEYGVGASWTKITIDIRDMNLRLWRRFFSGLLAEDEFVLLTRRSILREGTKNKFVVYNPKKRTLRDIVIRGTPTEYIVMGTYVESLISPNQCNHGGGIVKQG